MIFKNRWKKGVLVLFGLIILIPAAQAQQPFDITDYFYATATFLSSDPELTIFHSDVKGVIHDNGERKIFDRMVSHCLRSVKISTDKMTGVTYSKFTDSDGDFFITETSVEGIPMSEGTFKFLHGTGKWKGISGGGKGKFIFMTRGKQQINPSTFQGYLRMIGTYELPKK